MSDVFVQAICSFCQFNKIFIENEKVTRTSNNPFPLLLVSFLLKMKKLYKLLTKNTASIKNIMNLISDMENYLNILESPRKKQRNFDAGKVRVMNSKVPMWDFYGVPQTL